jgi:ATP-binding cassette subfamily F protein 3
MASVDALVEALKAYEGTLVFISHDLYFINALADHVAHVENGKVTLYPGNYEYFKRRRAQEALEKGEAAPVVPSSTPRREAPADAGHGVKSSSDDVRRFKENEKARRKARQKINARLAAIEEELIDARARMDAPTAQSDYKKLMELDGAVKALEAEKARLSAELAAA